MASGLCGQLYARDEANDQLIEQTGRLTSAALASHQGKRARKGLKVEAVLKPERLLAG